MPTVVIGPTGSVRGQGQEVWACRVSVLPVNGRVAGQARMRIEPPSPLPPKEP